MSQEPARMTPLSAFTPAARARIVAVLTDIDDTLTADGRLPALAYEALEHLNMAGFLVVPVTGRPAGWCDMIARLWPVDGVIGENGAFYFRYDRQARRMVRRYFVDAEERRENRRRLRAIATQVLVEVPGCQVAADQPFREVDLAIDFAEDVPALPTEHVAAIVRVFETHGARAKVSSIHVNGWFGDYDKGGMVRRFLAEQFGLDVDRGDDNERVVFVGDSPNDAPLFDLFRNSIGVANFAAFADGAVHLPRWLTRANGGRGFREVADCLLDCGG